MSDFRKKLSELINYESMENGSDTPDFILAEYLEGCLAVFDATLQKREEWYGRPMGATGETRRAMAEVTEEDREAARVALDRLGPEGSFAWQRGYALDVAAECHAVQRERADAAEKNANRIHNRCDNVEAERDEVEASRDAWHEQACKDAGKLHGAEGQRDVLWVLLDDIDTASDIYKDDYEGLAKRVYELQQKRHAVVNGDEVFISVARRSGLVDPE